MPTTIPSQLDLLTPFDPTGYGSVSGAQLEQLVGGSIPYTDKGLITVTTDIGASPQVPDAVTYTKWQNYMWVRISPTTSSISCYVWNPNGTSVATYLKWTPVTIAGIGVGSITGAMIGALAVTNANINDVAYTKITGTPTTLPPSGAASGDLTGVYPSPTIAALAVTNTKLAASSVGTSNIIDQAVTSGKIATNAVTNTQLGLLAVQHVNIGPLAVQPTTDIQGNSIVANQLRVAANGLNMEFFTPNKIVNLTSPIAGTDAYKIVRVNASGTGYEQVSATSPGQAIQRQVSLLSSVQTITTAMAAVPGAYPGPGPQSGSGTGIFSAINFTPQSILSTVVVDVFVNVQPGNYGFIGALFLNGSSNPTAVNCSMIYGNTFSVMQVHYEYSNTALTTLVFDFRGGSYGGPGTNIYINGNSNGAPFGTAMVSSMVIQEITHS